jgi:hemolysin activation/secretion protein
VLLHFRRALAGFLICSLPTSVWAQIATPPSPAAVVPQGSPIQREQPRAFPSTAPGLQPVSPPPATEFAPGEAVAIGSVVVTGATVYPPGAIASLTQGLTGPAVPLSRVEQARQNLLARYRADGYLLTTVSSTVTETGELRFTVVEGYIADVKLQGDIGPAGTQVLRFLNRLLEERPIRISTLERYLLLATDVPGVTVSSVLQPSRDDPAAVTLIAQVARKAYDGLLAADNRAFRQTGPQQLLAVGALNSFTEFGERTELSILHAFNNTQTFGQAATEFFIGGSGLRMRLYAGEGGANPSDPGLRTLGYDGRTRVFGVQASYPIIRSRQQTLLAVAAFDAIESDIRTDTGPVNEAGKATAVRASFDSLRVARAGMDYALQDLLLGGDRVGINNVTFRLSKGLDGLGATRSGDPEAGRQGSRTDFFKFNAEISRTQTLFHPWETATVNLFGLVAGQISNSVLPPAEKFFLGGIRYNRGFYAGEVTGDNALTASVELQLNMTVPLDWMGQTTGMSTQFYLFRDWGQTWENQKQDLNRQLRSFGAGVRAQPTAWLATELEFVSRGTRRPQGGTGQVLPLSGNAIYWRAITRF